MVELAAEDVNDPDLLAEAVEDAGLVVVVCATAKKGETREMRKTEVGRESIALFADVVRNRECVT